MKNKLLNFTICQVLVVIVMSLSHVKCDDNKASTSLPAADARNVTQYDRSFHKLLSRRKRFLLWRPGSNVLVSSRTFLHLFPNSLSLIQHNFSSAYSCTYKDSSFCKTRRPRAHHGVGYFLSTSSHVVC